MVHLDLNHVMTALGSAALKATLILALATLLTLLLRRHTAALRHLIWTAALGSTVAVLVLPGVLPAWRVIPSQAIPLGAIASRATAVSLPLVREQANASAAGRPSLSRDAGAVSSGTPSVRPPLTTPRESALPALLIGLWLVGVAVVVSRYASSRIALHRLARSSAPHAEYGALVQQISRRMRIARPVFLRNSDDVELPFTWGVFHPRIVLPSDASEWTPDRLRHVLEHELAHIRRLDAGTQLVAQAASALFWFHPLVWYAVGQMRCERERACDDHVLATGADAADYAGDLLALVTNYKYIERHSAALAFARRSHFEGRLLALLDRNLDRGVLSPRRIAIVLGISAAFVVPLAAVRSAEPRVAAATLPMAPIVLPAYADTSAPTAPRSRLSAPPAAPDRSARQTQAPDIQDVFAGCASRMNHHDSETDSDDAGRATWTASGRSDDCSFSLESEGQITFNGDATTITRISPRGYFDASANIRGVITRLVIRGPAADGGDLTYELSRAGQPAGVLVASSTWLAQFLIGLDRTTAFAVDIRLPELLQAGGPGAVLNEVDRMHSDHAKIVYLRRLISNATLDADAVRRTGDAVASMNAPHEAAEVIVAIASRYPLTDPATRAVFLGRALALTEDHEQARTLLSILESATLRGDETAAVLGALTSMSGDHEKSRVLLAVAATQQLDGNLRSAFVQAAESIRDARERSRALAGLAVR